MSKQLSPEVLADVFHREHRERRQDVPPCWEPLHLPVLWLHVGVHPLQANQAVVEALLGRHTTERHRQETGHPGHANYGLDDPLQVVPPARQAIPQRGVGDDGQTRADHARSHEVADLSGDAGVPGGRSPAGALEAGGDIACRLGSCVVEEPIRYAVLWIPR
eukprot:CAMPEP_0198686946 /NCGR_PEP_ID=MMETSP1468-20131203/33263_1 /TAXON_ID=1461545 /ORGANISM="Mantoniella sp, Strain CCMP1436" /LENGTH=161 /DNA_ID=CAMNT_0044433819 /DNA_START=190 /DNA_END=672 /DNA_ORIENTATION=+